MTWPFSRAFLVGEFESGASGVGQAWGSLLPGGPAPQERVAVGGSGQLLPASGRTDHTLPFHGPACPVSSHHWMSRAERRVWTLGTRGHRAFMELWLRPEGPGGLCGSHVGLGSSPGPGIHTGIWIQVPSENSGNVPGLVFFA